MTSLAEALAIDPHALPAYNNRDVLRTAFAIRNAGDGLSEAMKIDPQVLDIGDTAYVLLECEVKAHDYEPIPNTDCLVLKQVLKAGSATLVEADFAQAKIEAQVVAIKKAKDAVTGQRSADEDEFKEGDPEGDDPDADPDDG